MAAAFDQATGRASFAAGLRDQSRITGALILREVHLRYGRDNIGYLWMIGEPMMLACVITLIHVAEASTRYTSDILPAPFAIIGYTTFIIFRNIFNKAEGVVEHNAPLFYHRKISIIDILLSRAIVDYVGCFATTIILLTLAVATGYASTPVRPLYLLVASLLMFWWSFALALIAVSLTHGSETLGRQMHVLSYFSIPISGAFWQMSWLPPTFRDWLQWFPMPLIFEQARYGYFRSASSEFVRPGYVVAWCAVLTYVGLFLVRRLRNHIHG